jgi:hypothetical protein
LPHWALTRLPKDFIQREATYILTDGVKDWKGKQYLVLGGERSLNETLNQALKLKDVMTAVRKPVRMQEVRDGAPTGTQSPGTEHHMSE